MVKFVKRAASLIICALVITMSVISVSAAENYRTWTQGDYRWAKMTLGSCSDTMSEIGCAVTSLAILTAHSQSASPDEVNPGTLCEYLSDNDGFDSYGNLYWAAVSGLVPDFGFTKKADISIKTEKAITNQLAGYINQGYYIVLSVRNDAHWVAVDTITDNEVYMFDPAQNKVHKLFDYYDAAGIPQVRLYKGKVAPAKVTVTGTASDVTYLTGHYKTNDVLNLRASYSTSSDVRATIPSGTTVVVTRVYDNQWGQIEYNGKTGWIYLEYADYTEASYTYKLGNYKVNELAGVYLRRGIGTQSTAATLVPYNAVLKVDLVVANWGSTSYNGSKGWICMEYLSYSPEAAVTTTATSATTTAKTTTSKTTTSKVTTTKVTTTKAATTNTQTTIAINSLIKGDLNMDKVFSKSDLILLNEYIANPVGADFKKRYIMDVNNDTFIDERDSVYLLKIINKGK